MTKLLGHPENLKAYSLSNNTNIAFEASYKWLKSRKVSSEAKKDIPQLQKFQMVANTGKLMQVGNFSDPVIIRMTGAKFQNEKTPVIMDHDVSKRIGHTTNRTIGSSEITAEALVSSKMAVAQGFVEDSKNGFPFQVSVGATIKKASFLEEGDNTEVNGKTIVGPAIIAEQTHINELTVTVLGADSQTSTVLAASKAISHTETPQMSKEFLIHLEAMGLKSSDLSKTALKKAEDKFQASQASPEVEEVPVEEVEDSLLVKKQRLAAMAEEEDRIDSIKLLCKQYGEEETLEVQKEVRKIKLSAIKENWSVDKTELNLIKEARPTPPAQHSHSSTTNLADAKVLECALSRQLGCPSSGKNQQGKKFGYEAYYDEKTLEAADAKNLRSLTLHQLMDLSIANAGMPAFHGSRKSTDFIRTFLTADNQLKAASGGFSTLAVTNILENVANKNLLAAYTAQPVAWPEICAVKNLTDFKAHAYYRLTTTGGYSKVAADGELKSGSFSDQKFTVTADTYGMILALTRQDIINDDLSAFQQIPTQLGRLSAQAIDFAFFDLLLLNTGNHFHSNNSNLIAVDFDHEGLTTATQTFMDQTNDDKPIGIVPDRVLVGTQDATLAGDLFAESVVDTMASTAKRSPKRNSHVGKFQPVVSSVLNNTSVKKMSGTAFSNQDANQWYMFGNPEIMACFNAGFLNGSTAPVIESAETSFDTLGMQWRSYHDWGISQADPKAGVKSTG